MVVVHDAIYLLYLLRRQVVRHLIVVDQSYIQFDTTRLQTVPVNAQSGTKTKDVASTSTNLQGLQLVPQRFAEHAQQGWSVPLLLDYTDSIRPAERLWALDLLLAMLRKL